MNIRSKYLLNFLALFAIMASMLGGAVTASPAQAKPAAASLPIQNGFPLYVANYYNNSIAKVDGNGTVSTFVSISHPMGLAFDANGDLYVSSYDGSGKISKVTPSGTVTDFATGLSYPYGVAFGSDGNLYVALGNGTIATITPGGTVTTFASGFGGSNLYGLAFDTSGVLYVMVWNTGSIAKVSSDGATITDFVAPGGVPDGQFLAFDSSGNLYVSQGGNHTVAQITPGGAVSAFATVSNTATGLAFDQSGNLYAASMSGTPYTNDDAIKKITSGGTVTTLATGFGVSDVSYGLAFYPATKVDVKGNSVSIANGDVTPATADHTDFGVTNVSAATTDRTFTIANIGGVNVNLTGTAPNYVTLSGSSDFSIFAQPSATTITPSGSTGSSVTFTVRFDPSDLLTKTATVSIANSDSSRDPYTFAIQGKGCPSPITVANNTDSGTGSLREAIEKVCNGGVINFDADYTITLASELAITDKAFTINGNGAANTIIQAGTCNPVTLKDDADATCTAVQTYRVFNISTTGRLTLNGVTVRHGNAANDYGGGIYADGTTTINDSVISGNTADYGGGGIGGEALTINNSVISGNKAFHTSGGYGGGLYAWGDATIKNSLITGNISSSGGIDDDYGGGIYNEKDLTLINSTVTGNTAGDGLLDGYGGGVANWGNNTDHLYIINSTISGNTADYGGALASGNGNTHVTNSILANSSVGADCYNDPANATIEITNSLIENDDARVGYACGGSPIAADPLLGALADNGGPTQTMLPALESPVIDAGDSAFCPSTDQRGFSRFAICDIGAVERIGTTRKASTPANDGWVLESKETSNIANTKMSTGNLRVGDDAKNRQYRSLLYFDTAYIPNNAVISKVVVKIKRESTTGLDTLLLGNLVADMKKGAFGLAALQPGDFSALAAPINTAGKFNPSTPPDDWYTLNISPANFKYINLVGATQFRVRFTKDDNNDKGADFITFYGDGSGDAPLFIVEYSLP